GMQDSDFIIAINKDATAPIMKAADVAIAGDFLKVIPEMIAQINTLKNK
ncbi:electron transfer flavoprotein subunit alpha, partial [Clostridium estertheticum]|nr:electron transfer flavoprotein subunit alpha [Clostridium estertheticum]MBU3218459.1 electron transfer flavoprotein subunit alpha [Clostridium estertheticum]